MIAIADRNRDIINIIHIEQRHSHTPHTRGVAILTRRLRTSYQWTWLTLEGSATSTLDAWLAVRMTSENNIQNAIVFSILYVSIYSTYWKYVG